MRGVTLLLTGILIGSAVQSAVGQQQGGGGGQAAREHRMTGCLQKGAEAGSYLVTDMEGRGPRTIGIVSARLNNLPGFLGRKVEVTGTTVPVAEAEKMDKKAPKAEHYMSITAVRLISLDVRGPLVPDEAKCP